jgi:biotin transport system substrate-specific component
MSFALTKPSLVNVLNHTQKSFLQTLLWVLAGSLVIAVSAQISIPLKPAPITFQSATVLLLGMVFGARLAGYMVLAYLAEGFCGLPVFANFYSGLAMLTDPTIGYLVGFLPAAIVSGYLVQCGWGRSWFSTFCAACLGAVIIFAGGVIGLACFVGWKAAFVLGVAPFLVTEPIKLLVVSLIAPRFWREQQTH